MVKEATGMRVWLMRGTTMVTVQVKVLARTIAQGRGHPVQALAGQAIRVSNSQRSTHCMKPMSR